jgi:hypothetical protein
MILLLAGLAFAGSDEPVVPAAPPALLELPRRTHHEPVPRLQTTAFRTSLPAGMAASNRIALVEDPGGPLIAETTLHVQAGFRWASLATEVVGVAGASDIWSSAGMGNVQLDARFLFGAKVTLAVGVRGTICPFQGPDPIAYWGTVPHATIPTNGFAFAMEGAVQRWVWHLHTGLRGSAWWGEGYTADMFDLATSVATVQPIGPWWSVVAEAELLSNPQTPLHFRGLMRRDLGRGWNVDVGLALPVVAFIHEPTIQVIGSLGWNSSP